MKRSEILNKIQDVISYKNNYLRKDGDDVTAEDILELIEKEGMLPPRTMTKLGPDNAWEDE